MASESDPMATTTAAQQLLGKTGMDDRDELPEPYWELVERYRGELLNQALAILGNLPDAEDAVQESFCEALRHPGKLARAKSLGAWLRAINRANALNHRRAQGRERRKSRRKQREAPERTVTTGGFSLLEMREAIAKAIEKLTPRQRKVVVLRHWEGLSYDEIAQRLGLPSGTVGRLLYEASQRLYDKLTPLLESAPPPAPPSGDSEEGAPGSGTSSTEKEERP